MMSIDSPPTRSATRFIFGICSASVVCVAGLSAFLSLAKIGTGVGAQYDRDVDVATEKQNTIAAIEKDRTIAAARTGQGIVGSRVTVPGIPYHDGFIADVIGKHSGSFKGRSGRVSIADGTGRTVGYYKDGEICDTIANPVICRPIIK